MLDRTLNMPGEAMFGRTDAEAAGWAVSTAPVAYPDAVAAMEARAAAIAEGRAGELVWLQLDCTWPVTTPLVSTLFTDGKYRFKVAATMRNEFFE